jgi:hypothetical protein
MTDDTDGCIDQVLFKNNTTTRQRIKMKLIIKNLSQRRSGPEGCKSDYW